MREQIRKDKLEARLDPKKHTFGKRYWEALRARYSTPEDSSNKLKCVAGVDPPMPEELKVPYKGLLSNPPNRGLIVAYCERHTTVADMRVLKTMLSALLQLAPNGSKDQHTC
eukprot:824601-Amphidinium_carterae.1